MIALLSFFLVCVRVGDGRDTDARRLDDTGG
jgi:hypothetical protein